MRQLFRPSAPGDGLDRPRAPEIGEGALVPLAKDPSPDIAKIVAEGVARIGRAGPIAEHVRVAMQLDAERGDIGF